MASTDFRLGQFIVEPTADRLMAVDGAERINLEPKSMAVLLVLAERAGQVVSSEELIHVVWHDRPMGDNPVYKSIAKLRRALADETGEPRYIETIPRKGYRLLLTPEPMERPAPPPAIAPTVSPGPAADAARSLYRFRTAALAAGLIVACAAAMAAFLPRGESTSRSDRAATLGNAADVRLQFSGLEPRTTGGHAAIDAALRQRLQGLPGIDVVASDADEPPASLRLSGSIRDAGHDRQQVQLRLDGPLGPGLWAGGYAVTPGNLDAVADSAAAAVLEARRVMRDADAMSRLPFATLQLYLLARSELHERRAGFASRLRADATDLIRAAPAFAPGHALLAVACSFSAAYASERPITLSDPAAGDAETALACARNSVRRALELDPKLAEAHAAAGLLALHEYSSCRDPCDQLGHLGAAQSSLELAVRIDPSLPEAHTWLGILYQLRGDFVRASEQAEVALALDPLNPVAVYNANNLRMARGEHDAVRERLLVLARRPDAPPYVYAQLSTNELVSGHPAEAARWARRLAAADTGRSVQVTAAALLARLGRRQEAQALLDGAEQTAGFDRGDAMWAALAAHECLGGAPAVRTYLESQQRGRAAAGQRQLGLDAGREWRAFQGMAYALAGNPDRALPLLEEVFGTAGPPRIRLSTAAQEADRANSLAWAYRELGNTTRAREIALGTLAALERLSSTGFDREPEFALARALTYELAGQHDHARGEIARAVALGWAQPADVSRDPRWASLVSTGTVRLAAVPKN